MLPPLYLICGPTASGKTALALEIARRQPSVIINADSMQVYRDLPILTAQPTKTEKTEIPHKLFEIFDPSEKSSAGKWVELAQKAIDEAVAENRTPILVGGTGLYFKALLEGIAEIPPIPETVRAVSIALYEKLGHDAFREALSKIDPESATKIKPNDRQRLIRAYEVATHTGKTLGEWQKKGLGVKDQGSGILEKVTIVHHILIPDRAELYARCDARFLEMMKRGALEEVRNLMTKNLDPDLPAMKVLGVRELAAHLRGEMTLEEAIQKAQQSTRNYAKRQVTWFRNQMTGD